MDSHFSALEKSDALDGMDSFYQRAYAMISSPEARDAFDINKEPASCATSTGAIPPAAASCWPAVWLSPVCVL